MSNSQISFESLSLVAKAYVECLFWADGTTEHGFPEGINFDSIAPVTLAAIVSDCASFEAQYGDLIGTELARAGQDFWLTRNGHGSGFMDGHWTAPLDSLLYEGALSFKDFEIYVGDDGLIYACGYES